MAMTLRIDDELETALSDLSESEGLSRQEIVKRAVLERHARSAHRQRVDLIASELMIEYGEALDRLGTV
jgi:predicted transcriptional regulator